MNETHSSSSLPSSLPSSLFPYINKTGDSPRRRTCTWSSSSTPGRKATSSAWYVLSPPPPPPLAHSTSSFEPPRSPLPSYHPPTHPPTQGISSFSGTAKATQDADNVLILQRHQGRHYLDLRKNRFDGDLVRPTHPPTHPPTYLFTYPSTHPPRASFLSSSKSTTAP